MAGGGVGEAMLIGAAIGGGSAAVTGGDPLKGALLGGLTGGAGAGIGGALGGAAGGAGAGTTAAATAGVEGALANALPLTSTGTIATTAAPTTLASTGSLPAGMNFAQASQAANQLASNAAIAQGTNAAMANALPLTANAGMPFSSAIGTGGVSNLPAATTAAAPSSFQAAMQNPLNYIKANPLTMGAAGIAGATGGRRPMEEEEEYKGPLSRFRFNPESYRPAFYADGGVASLPSGYDRMVGEMPMYQRMARGGGISDLGTYSDGGRMLKGPGDGMSDSIPGVIANKRPARLADGEFVVPADVVSHLGNGSTDAGAKQLYAMMDKVRKARTGTKKQGREINPRKYVPA